MLSLKKILERSGNDVVSIDDFYAKHPSKKWIHEDPEEKQYTVLVKYGREEDKQLIRHHLDDIKSALKKAYSALEFGDLEEVKDNAVLIQGGSLDVEELVTGKEPKL